MTKNFYEFLLKMRGSGFWHNSPENKKQLLYQAMQSSLPEFRFNRGNGDLLTANWIDGEIGFLSNSNIRMLQNAVISMSSTILLYAIDCHADQEQTHFLCDFFIEQAETITTYQQFDTIISELFTQFHELISQNQSISYGRIIDKCIHYIDQHLYSPLRLKDIAEFMGYSSSYLSALFKTKTGVSIQPYILDKKIEEAKKLLYYTEQPLTCISSALGFSSLSHFSTAFKKITGMTPLQYRNRNQL